jgi:RNA polymerase sigma-70 factor (ECF subfamily)
MSSYPTVLQNENLMPREGEAATKNALHAERTDRQLVDMVLAGDEAAFEEIFDRYKRLVAAVAARYFRQPAEIEEAVQTTFTKAYFELKNFRGLHEASMGGWFGRIAANACLDALRVQKRRPECELTESEVMTFAEPANVSDSESRTSDRDLAEKLLARLPPEDRALLQMLYAEEMSVNETARSLGWSASKVKVRAWRARRSLRKVLKTLL